ncbi:MAG TPA: class I SAM-dependent methyltransferase [Candidatus Angelobacter sp.]|nr:class I SAM-dependent methyltransferase [Candidatus Angelobacter sp.]
MKRHEFLREVHARLRPRNYLEIGTNTGRSLTLSRVPTIAVDPAFTVNRGLRCDLHLVRATSDDFFARRDPIRHLRSGRNPIRNLQRGRPAFAAWTGGTTVDFSFIDGLHHFEFALRDFMNVERFSGPASLIVFDDIYPRDVDEAARDRHTPGWAGDVFKITEVLRRHRPDLVVLPMDTQPTGVLVVLGADPKSTVLRRAYDRIVAEEVRPDPQDVPARVLERHDAVDPGRFLDSPILGTLAATRRPWSGRGTRSRLHELAMDLRPVRG